MSDRRLRKADAKAGVRTSAGAAQISTFDRLPLNALRVFEAVAANLSFAEAAEALRIEPHFRLSKVTMAYKFPADRDRVLDGMRKAGLPD